MKQQQQERYQEFIMLDMYTFSVMKLSSDDIYLVPAR